MMEFLHIPKTGGSSVQAVIDIKTQSWGHYAISLIPEEKRETVWAVIRNPYDRAVSIWRYLLEQKRTVLDFKEFWLSNPNHPASRIGSIELPQTDYISVNGEIAVKTLVEFNDLPRFIQTTFGKELPHKNKSDRGEYKEYYDDEMYDLITEKYKQDLTLFNYEY